MKRGTAVLIVTLLVVAPVAGTTAYLVVQRLLTSAIAFPGELALEILQDDPYTDLVIEVDWTAGEAPSQAALETLEARILTYTHKERVEVVLSGVVEVNRTEFTSRDLHDVERANRDEVTGGSTLALYFLYVAGELEGGRNALAASYTGGSVAVFKEVVRRAAGTANLAVDVVETSVLVHEVGHLMGLVNLVYDSELDYEDPDRPFHSTNRSDVMFWAIEIQMGFATEPPNDFGFETRFDLEKLRNGEYETFPSRLREAMTLLLAVGWTPAAVAWARKA